MIAPLRQIVIVFLSRWAVQPWSHMTPIDSRAPAAKFGKMCAFRASVGRVGSRRSQVCVDLIVLPSGSRM